MIDFENWLMECWQDGSLSKQEIEEAILSKMKGIELYEDYLMNNRYRVVDEASISLKKFWFKVTVDKCCQKLVNPD